ncbi:hypothetical protein GCM10011579_094880 [Streptomyces albiflavescens]|uniref:Uncharacterized protein n=1 Tax=Streptomyces albiflavescens TaxID=1623582 RepID=A0A917YFV9_9ACTN|nr:hypothetical protein GCM10011579_094880 [Streptomyces albiflavescens]
MAVEAGGSWVAREWSASWPQFRQAARSGRPRGARDATQQAEKPAAEDDPPRLPAAGPDQDTQCGPRARTPGRTWLPADPWWRAASAPVAHSWRRPEGPDAALDARRDIDLVGTVDG